MNTSNPAPKRTLEEAVEAYKRGEQDASGKKLSARDLAGGTNFAHSTIIRRAKGQTSSYSNAQVANQALTPGEEDILVNYIRRMSLSGHPPPTYHVHDIAQSIRDRRIPSCASAFAIITPLGHNWVDKFRSRHPEVHTAWTRSIDTARLRADSPAKLAPWFAELGSLLNQHHYPPNFIYNMDETGFAIGKVRSHQVLIVEAVDGLWQPERAEIFSGKKARQSTGPRQEWVTSIECISAAGTVLPPLIILKRDLTGPPGVPAHWLPKDQSLSSTWKWTTTYSGYSNSFMALEWLTKHFDPITCPTSTPSQRRLLILDGHGTHVTASFIAYCFDHAIDLMVLPAHLSHITQPLDVGIFQPLKSNMSRLGNTLARYHSGAVPKHVFAQQLVTARAKAMTRSNIEVGWSKTGIHPFQPNLLVRPPPTAPSTPPPTGRIPLSAFLSENRAFIRDHIEIITTPIKKHLERREAVEESVFTENTLLKKENDALKAAIDALKKPRGGVTVSNYGQHLFSTEEIIAKVRAAEEKTKAAKAAEAAKKGKGKGKEKAVFVPSVSNTPTEHSPEPADTSYTTVDALGASFHACDEDVASL